jgi:site-specific DNA-methyltransferase (adenine-specific)
MANPLKDFEGQLGQIHHRDCVSGMASLPEGCIDLVFADPPFNIGYDYDVYDDRLDSQNYVDWSRQWMAQVRRVLKPDGTFWLAIGDEYAAELKLAAQPMGFHCRSWVIWYYTFGVHCHNKFTRSHAHLFHFVSDPERFVFNNASVRVPSARQLVYRDSRANPVGRMPDDTWILRPQDLCDGFNADEDVWYFPRVAGTFKERAGFHGCQMPEQLMGRIIRACSNEGDIVLDPFSGSGTTLAVAKKLGRRWLGFELSPEYAKQGTSRLRSIAVGDRLDGAEEPRVSAPRTGEKPSSKRKMSTAAAPRHGFATGALEYEPLWEAAASLLEVFAQVNAGFSVDRLVADPALNERFQLAADRKSVPGTPAERNRLLFRLRKAGRLTGAGLDTSRRTAIDWNHLTRFIFASEIAWRCLSDYNDQSLDEILCDPDSAREFDQVAARFAPGFQPLEYRWGALRLRKLAHIAREHARDHVSRRGLRFPDNSMMPLAKLDLAHVPNQAGIYIIRARGGESLYASETSNLRERLLHHFGSEQTRWAWDAYASDLEVALLSVNTVDDYPLARQCVLLAKYRPRLNQVDQLAI